MSMFNDIDGQREELQNEVFRVPDKSRSTRRDSRQDTGHFSALETKRSGAELSVTHLGEKWGCIFSHMVERFKETGHPVFKNISVLWVVEFWKERITETPDTSMRILRRQNPDFEWFTQQISSVSTEEWPALSLVSLLVQVSYCCVWNSVFLKLHLQMRQGLHQGLHLAHQQSPVGFFVSHSWSSGGRPGHLLVGGLICNELTPFLCLPILLGELPNDLLVNLVVDGSGPSGRVES